MVIRYLDTIYAYAIGVSITRLVICDSYNETSNSKEGREKSWNAWNRDIEKRLASTFSFNFHNIFFNFYLKIVVLSSNVNPIRGQVILILKVFSSNIQFLVLSRNLLSLISNDDLKTWASHTHLTSTIKFDSHTFLMATRLPWKNHKSIEVDQPESLNLFHELINHFSFEFFTFCAKY